MRPKGTIWARRLAVLGALAALGYVASFEIELRISRSRAAACLSEAEGPRGPELPSCSGLVRGFDRPSTKGWTRTDATYQAEELLARVAMNEYRDAAIGAPSSERLSWALKQVARHEAIVKAGSRRINLEDLGDSVMAPDIGKLASSLGDRVALLENFKTLELWYLQKDALEAALVEADFELATELAETLKDAELGSGDLSTTVGALLCLSDPREGLPILQAAMDARAEKRSADIQRDFGEVLAVAKTCSFRAGQGAERGPYGSGAGTDDAPHLSLLAELRETGEGDASERAKRELGASGSGGASGSTPWQRLHLIAGLLAYADGAVTDAELADWVHQTWRESGGKSPFGDPEGLMTVRAAFHRGVGLELGLPADGYARALAHLKLRRSKPGAFAAPEETRLRDLSGHLALLAALESARLGRGEEAATYVDEGAIALQLSDETRSGAAGAAFYLAGDRDRARNLRAGFDQASENPDHLLLDWLLAATMHEGARAKELAERLRSRAATPELITLGAWATLRESDPIATQGPLRPQFTGQADVFCPFDFDGPKSEATLAAFRRALGAPAEDKLAFRYELQRFRGDMPPVFIGTLATADRLLPSPSGESHEIWLDALMALDLDRFRIREVVFGRREVAILRGDEASAALWTERLRVIEDVLSDETHYETSRFLRL